MVMDGRERFTFRIPSKLLSQIREHAGRIGVSVNALILQILWNWTREQEQKGA